MRELKPADTRRVQEYVGQRRAAARKPVERKPYRFELSFVAGLADGDDEALLDWATRRLESMPGVYVQVGMSQRMESSDVVIGSPLDAFIKAGR